jgi:hypothetical protein
VRAQLMAKAAQEAKHEAWLTNFGGMLAEMVADLTRAIINSEHITAREGRAWRPTARSGNPGFVLTVVC